MIGDIKLAYNKKRSGKQNRINKAQDRLDRDNARSERDLNRNKWKKIKSNIVTFFIVIFILALIVLYLQK